MAKEELIKTGEVFIRDEQGNLCLVESFVDSDSVVTSTSIVIEYSENTYPKQNEETENN